MAFFFFFAYCLELLKLAVQTPKKWNENYWAGIHPWILSDFQFCVSFLEGKQHASLSAHPKGSCFSSIRRQKAASLGEEMRLVCGKQRAAVRSQCEQWLLHSTGQGSGNFLRKASRSPLISSYCSALGVWRSRTDGAVDFDLSSFKLSPLLLLTLMSFRWDSWFSCCCFSSLRLSRARKKEGVVVERRVLSRDRVVVISAIEWFGPDISSAKHCLPHLCPGPMCLGTSSKLPRVFLRASKLWWHLPRREATLQRCQRHTFISICCARYSRACRQWGFFWWVSGCGVSLLFFSSY